MEPREDKGKLERLEQDLFTPDAHIERKEYKLSPTARPVSDKWKQKENTTPLNKKKKTLLDKLLIGALVFFVVAGALAILAFQTGFNSISSDNIELVIDIPDSVDAGETIVFNVEVTNNNESRLLSSELVIEFPDNARNPEDMSELDRVRVPIESLNSGETISEELSVVIFGQEGDEVEFAAFLEYQIEASNATFSDSERKTVKIDNVPIKFTISAPEKVSIGQLVEIEVEIASNTRERFDNLLLRADYPQGFTFEEASVDPTYDEMAWKIDRLAPQEKLSITLSGVLEGGVREDKEFTFTLGTQDGRNNKLIDLPFAVVTEEIELQEPALELFVLLPESRIQDGVLEGLAPVDARIVWRNNSGSRFTNGKITATLEGEGVSMSSLDTTGVINTANRTITWTEESDLENLASGDRGEVVFTFTPRIPPAGADPSITLSLFVEGQAGSGSRRITAQAVRTLKISSSLELTADSLYGTGPLSNEGPIPPTIGEETTYTARISLSNSLNDLEDVVMEAYIPDYVEWLDKTEVSRGSVNYNSRTRMLQWDVGELSGSGSASSATLFVQIEITPTLNQLNTSPLLLRDIEVRAQDSFTNETITAASDGVTTLIGDPGTTASDGRVVEE